MARFLTPAAAFFGAAIVIAAPAAHALDEAHARKGREVVAKAIDYLRAQQDEQTGGWAINPSGPNFPAITGLVLNGMLLSPDIDTRDPAVAKGLDFLLSHAQPDGGIYDRVLPSYNTALALSAFAKASSDPRVAEKIRPAQDFLRNLQWSEDPASAETQGQRSQVNPDHPFYGGVGYGSHSRPDLSNLSIMLQALRDTGVSSDDPAFQRALVFLARTQMLDEVNDMPYADGSSQGGFIYSTGESPDEAGEGESKVREPVDESLNGERVSRLRAYGSMTYAGFKSLIYADLDRDDARVQAAYDWLRREYTLDENPGMGAEGQYYYYLVMAKALHAWGLPAIEVETGVASGDGAPATVSRDWANDLIDALADLQQEDGSFEFKHDRWMEDNAVLRTAYCLLAAQHALGRE